MTIINIDNDIFNIIYWIVIFDFKGSFLDNRGVVLFNIYFHKSVWFVFFFLCQSTDFLHWSGSLMMGVGWTSHIISQCSARSFSGGERWSRLERGHPSEKGSVKGSWMRMQEQSRELDPCTMSCSFSAQSTCGQRIILIRFHFI